jgi:hypothetical protein
MKRTRWGNDLQVYAQWDVGEASNCWLFHTWAHIWAQIGQTRRLTKKAANNYMRYGVGQARHRAVAGVRGGGYCATKLGGHVQLQLHVGIHWIRAYGMKAYILRILGPKRWPGYAAFRSLEVGGLSQAPKVSASSR